MKIHTSEKIILPLLLISFFITYHYYDFYQNDFNKIFQYIKFTFAEKQYEQIQEFHPFYYVYKTAQDTKKNNQNVIYIKTRTDKKNAQYLDELNIMVNYFFYPRIVKSYSLAQFYKTTYKPKTLIISDYPLHVDKQLSDKIRYFRFIKKNLSRVNKWPEKDFYIYKVI